MEGIAARLSLTAGMSRESKARLPGVVVEVEEAAGGRTARVGDDHVHPLKLAQRGRHEPIQALPCE